MRADVPKSSSDEAQLMNLTQHMRKDIIFKDVSDLGVLMEMIEEHGQRLRPHERVAAAHRLASFCKVGGCLWVGACGWVPVGGPP